MLVRGNETTAISWPPGPRLPTLAQSMLFLMAERPFLDRAVKRYGEIIRLRLQKIGELTLISDPDLIKQIFTDDPTTLHAGEGNDILGPLVGSYSVLLLDEDRHLRQRKLLLPPFHGDRMRIYEKTMRQLTDDEIASWQVGETISLHVAMQRITIGVILRAVFGIEDARRLTDLEDRLIKLLNLIHGRAMLPWGDLDFGRLSPYRRFEQARESVDELLFDEIARRRTEDLAGRTDIFSLLLQARDEDGNALSDQELRDELITLLAAGHETTATTMAWFFERVLRHPEVLTKLKAEIAANESDEYLDATIKETLRIRPVLDFAARRTQGEYEIGSYTVPAGVTLGASIYLTHTRPDVYPDPHSFRPERFIGVSPETYSWIPFGGGIRRCIGAAFAQYEMKVVLGEILRRVELRPRRARSERIKRKMVTHIPAQGAQAVVVSRR